MREIGWKIVNKCYIIYDWLFFCGCSECYMLFWGDGIENCCVKWIII